jgi:CheY-like chemotaxis protein
MSSGATRRFKEQEHTRGIPVIILTAHALEQDRLKRRLKPAATISIRSP